MKTVIAIATYKREALLEKTLESLKGQADEIRVYDNAKERRDYKANAKFIFLKDYSEPINYITCDDDIIYPLNYVNLALKGINKHQSIVTYHGDILLKKNRTKYPEFERFHFRQTVGGFRFVDVAGTGLTGFNTEYFNPIHIYKSSYVNMVDQLFSLEAAKQGKKITLLGHSNTMFISQKVPEEDTIWGKHKNTRRDQIFLANEILKIKDAERKKAK